MQRKVVGGGVAWLLARPQSWGQLGPLEHGTAEPRPQSAAWCLTGLFQKRHGNLETDCTYCRKVTGETDYLSY